ncbi:terminase [Streptomyces sp. NBC_00237]|uniref:terminase n=1 Tax=Streptomyces sp. NBC_00237 TaxID=2975687 RepID=UPI0022518C1B|nr:terminase [Streptomyces sp. NBC_00237]MCX5201054.1 terminase [Streptomyces sp. NBC_00237]
MTSLLDGPPAVAPDLPYGVQEPRLTTVPPFVSSSGQEAIELAAVAGLELDPWQQHVLHVGLGERADGTWSAFETCVNVPRQNGKGAIIEARELAGLFLLGEKLIIHSAHEFKTAIVGFKRIEQLIMNCDDLRKRVARVRRTTGEEAIELLTGQTLRFLARSSGSGRGFTGHCNILDEAMHLGDEGMGALMPTMAAVKNPQVFYLGSAGIGRLSMQLARLRARALAAVESGVPDPSLAYLEWSIDPHVRECRVDCTEHDDPAAPESVARANPALGYRLSMEHTERERLTMGPDIYARERLGVGDYPSDGGDTWSVISEDAWRALTDGQSKPSDPVAFSLDMTPERSHASICVAGQSGEAIHVEVVENRPGTDWVIARAVELTKKWRPRCWVIDGGGPAGSLIKPLVDALTPEEQADLPEDERTPLAPVVQPKVREIAQGCGQFYDAVVSGALVHIDQAPLATALAGARKRDLGDAWAWARRSEGIDISPLVAATFAAWGLTVEVEEPEEEVEPWAAYG